MKKLILFLLLTSAAFAQGAGQMAVFGATAGGGGGAVDSVFGRTGDVTAEVGDYSSFYGVLGSSNSWSGVNTYANSFIFTPATISVVANAGTVDVDKVRSVATNGANLTLTPSAAGTTGQQIRVDVVNSDTSGHTLTGAGSASTISYTLAANSTTTAYWQSDGSAWNVIGGAVTINDISTVTPATGDFIAFWDISGGVTGKATLANIASAMGVAVAGTDTQIQYNNSGALGANAGLVASKTTGAVTHTRTTISANTAEAGVTLTNTTAASSGNQQYSPALKLTGQGWKTDATAASQAVDWQIFTIPVQGASAPTSTLAFQSAVNAGAFTTRFSIASSGNISTGGSVTGANFVASSGGYSAVSTSSYAFSSRSLILSPSDGTISLRNNANNTNSALLYSVVIAAKTQAVSPYSVLITENGTVFTNEGATAAVTFNLPTAVAGYQYTFTVQDADDIIVTASSGDTIRIAGSVTATAGSITGADIGASVTLVAVNATEWIATSSVGTWTF